MTLSMEGITKRFFGTTVLDEVSLECRSGEIHAIVGENGAGKSTLMKVLSGVHQQDGGRILLDGREARFTHPRQALAEGISVIYQEFTLLPDRTVAENISLGREPRRAGVLVDRGAMERRAAELLASIGGEAIDPKRLARHLTVAQQQTVEIAKALSYDPRILVMDEPTAALPPADVAALFAQVRRLASQGRSVLYISHRLAEVFELADRVTVLKDGRRVATMPVSETGPEDLARLMVGREMSNYYPERRSSETGPVRLSLRGARAAGLHGVDLEVRAGEIVGLAGLEGSGRTQLARALFGVTPLTGGDLEIDGRQVRIGSPRAAIRAGLAYLTADRKAEGLVLGLRGADNARLATRALGRGLARSALEGIADQVGLRPEALRRESRLLSGGNQQKVVLAKWLATEATVYVLDEPTRGIDIGAKAGIHEVIRELADRGAAVLMISSELPEVIGMSDRIVVMRDGAVAGELPAGTPEEEIMLVAQGARAA
ncbi:sugar ABC transporter ATP-binding protein [Planotetraspora sp. A-T 1434]|uniref:sugar ABC transporter ATP-binding protein n=1 Tax=Planotetraspora sp. A-T 1434 TaxID=2979219 RepID=UPI0021BE8912|nr:sugar ABC transporter ATP-binding protein [Planotetraspora sp. A-T 1434]MCT9929288.1 sugar ABC transporter ATP-binding protein [Planotetraspora sp. A-T 1434]